MVKKNITYSIQRQQKRAAIQVYHKKFPNVSDKELSRIFEISRTTVSKWKNKVNFQDTKRKRKSKLSRDIKRYLLKRARNKYTGIDGASSRKLSIEIRNKFSLNISKTTINNWLNRLLNKPVKAKKTFILRKKDKDKRIEFANYIINNNISGKSIFFTDEKRFVLNSPLNKQTNQIRMDKKGMNEYKSEKGEFFEKIAHPQAKFPKSIMVAAGISYYGVGKLIFITGTMTSFSYMQVLDLYKEDIGRLGQNLMFQKDNAPCHISKSCLNYINENFKNKLEFWPANSPDLSPIEELWALVQEKIGKYNFESTEELAKKLQYIWNRIPKRLCQHLVMSFDKKIQKIKGDGERANKREHSNNKSIGDWVNKWNNAGDNIERIVYNKNSLDRMKFKKIKELKGKIKSIEKDFQEAKSRYSTENKKIIKKDSKQLYKFFLSEEEDMKNEFKEKIDQKKAEIKKYEETKGKDLFELFSKEEKINNLSINIKKIKRIGSTNYSSINIE